MKGEKIFTIGSIVTFFALLPALIIMEVRVLREMPQISYLFIIADILLVGFIALEIFILIRRWKRGKEEPVEVQETETVKVEEEWNEEKIEKSTNNKEEG